MAQNKNNMSVLFTVMNRIAAEQGISKKEAYQLAKKQLEQNNDDLATALVARMQQGYVKFTFTNSKGKQITTTGTLDMTRVPTTRKVEGSQKPKSESHVVFYDGRHGVYRQFDKSNLVAVM